MASHREADHWQLVPGAEQEVLRDAAVQIDAFVLLGGALRTDPLSRVTGRSVLELPVSRGRTMLDWWFQQAAEVARHALVATLPMRVQIDRSVRPPRVHRTTSRVHCQIERDLSDFRGVGGLLRDVADGYADDDVLLVANASQPTIEPLSTVVRLLSEANADVAMLADARGVPAGVMLMRCAALRSIAPIGYVDLKEQALPQLARSFDVRVVRGDQPACPPIRTAGNYLSVLHALATARTPSATFGIAEIGSNVDPQATLRNAVVLRGASVEPGACITRSIVCSGAHVARGAIVADRVLTAAA